MKAQILAAWVSGTEPGEPPRNRASVGLPGAATARRGDRCPAWLAGSAVGLLGLLALTAACSRSETQPGPSEPVVQVRQPERDHLALAMDSLAQRDDFPLDRAARQTLYHLNRWIQDQGADPRWMVDRRLINTLPTIIRNSPAYQESLSDRVLAQLEFRPGDVQYLEECRWLRHVAQWVIQSDADPAFQQWAAESGLPAPAARQLHNCAKLFRWTVRNIQLEELLPYPKQAAAGPAPLVESDNLAATWPAPMRGQPGPGYRLQPWHVLLYGYGDMLERARVFMLLARQIHVDAVMLAVQTRTERPRAWVPAVWLEGQLYLFDTQLGLPIPGPAGAPIATLSQVRAEPALLTGLDVGEKYRYRVRPDDLASVVALLDASPESLSQRMRVLETHLDAVRQMVLAFPASRVKRELETSEAVAEVRLWAVPIEAEMYTRARAMLVAKDPKIGFSDVLDHGVMMGLNPLVKARRQYLLGNFTGQDDVTGATRGYVSVRTPNEQIESIGSSAETRQRLGIERPLDMNDQQWNQRLQTEQYLRVQAKQNASYWLGIVHLEQGNHEVAANWFKKRTLDAWPQGRWKGGARVNLALCYEALDRADEARELYLVDDSPQRHGSLLRARRLDKAAATQPPGSESTGQTDSAVTGTP